MFLAGRAKQGRCGGVEMSATPLILTLRRNEKFDGGAPAAPFSASRGSSPSLPCSAALGAPVPRRRCKAPRVVATSFGRYTRAVWLPVGHLRHPTTAEGIGYFHVPIAYSAPCRMAETRWANPSDEARGTLLNFLDNECDDEVQVVRY